MQPLTHQVWRQHYTELRQHVLERFPQVDPEELEGVTDDYDRLIELIQRSTGMDADRVIDQVRGLDVHELGIGYGEGGDEEASQQGSVNKLALGQGFSQAERPRILARMEKLNRHLKRFHADNVWLELSVKDRDTPAQVVTLSAELPALGRLVTTSKENDIPAALADVRDDMVDQIREGMEKRSRGAR
jgi:ribosome-associated translation inhibitor RaiA